MFQIIRTPIGFIFLILFTNFQVSTSTLIDQLSNFGNKAWVIDKVIIIDTVFSGSGQSIKKVKQLVISDSCLLGKEYIFYSDGLLRMDTTCNFKQFGRPRNYNISNGIVLIDGDTVSVSAITDRRFILKQYTKTKQWKPNAPNVALFVVFRSKDIISLTDTERVILNSY